MSRRLAVLLAGTAMAALMVATASVAGALDGTTPQVVKTVPVHGKTGFDRDNNIKTTFSEAMNVDTVLPGNPSLYRGSLSYKQLNPNCGFGCGDPVPLGGRVTYNAATNTVTLNPTNRLRASTWYTASVEGSGDNDTDAVQDLSGMELGRDYIWRFKTGAN